MPKNKFNRIGLLLGLVSSLFTGCSRDITHSMSVVVMPDDIARAWLRATHKVDKTVSIALTENMTLVPGLEFVGYLDEDLEVFECKTSLRGNEIHVEIEARSSDMTDDIPGSSRRLCPGVGPLASGTYTVYADGLQVSITVPSTVNGDQLFLWANQGSSPQPIQGAANVEQSASTTDSSPSQQRGTEP